MGSDLWYNNLAIHLYIWFYKRDRVDQGMDVLRYRQHYQAVGKIVFKLLQVQVLLHVILPKLVHTITTDILSLL